MNKQIVLVSIALLSITGACKNTSHKEDKKDIVTSEVHDDAHNVKLNDGKKWVANPETHHGIEKMITLIKNFNTGNDVNKLKESLEHEFQLIFKRCTMEGKAHQQLHNYLLPLKEKIGRLNEQSDKEDIEKIHAYLSTFENYFK